MGINRNIEAIIVTLLYLTCLYYWTLPIQQNPLPYGEVDAASHFAIADYSYQSDRSITSLPYYIDKRYGHDNSFKNHVLWYPPPFHTGLAIAAVFGGESVVPIFVTNAIFCSLIVLSVYFIMRKLFGFEVALLSGFLLIFSMRDVMIYLWGQWPERMGFAFLPLILYCFYKYSVSYLDKEEKPIYLYIMSVLLAINLFIHPMDFFHSVAAILIVGLLFLIKEKRLFFGFKHLIGSVLLFLVIISIFPYQTMNVVVKTQGEGEATGDISRMLYWFKPQEDNQGVPASYFSYKAMIGPYFTIAFIFLGILFLLLRRNKKDLVLLGWLVSLYIMIHLDVIGKGRVHRSLSGTAHIFYPLMVLGVVFLISIIPGFKQYKKAIRYGAVIVFGLLMFFSFGIQAQKQLAGAYQGLLRVNPYQQEVISWLQVNTPDDALIYHMGSVSVAKTRWIWMLSHRAMDPSVSTDLDKQNYTHAIVDYSDFGFIGDQNSLDKIQEWEQQNMANNTLLYDKDYIRVFKLEN
jgi:hypothetical protein